MTAKLNGTGLWYTWNIIFAEKNVNGEKKKEGEENDKGDEYKYISKCSTFGQLEKREEEEKNENDERVKFD